MFSFDKIINMKRVLVIISVLFCAIQLNAQDRKFDPAKFQADLEQFIVTQAALTPQEASTFFPLYRELANKQRSLFDQMRRYHHIDTSDDKVCAEAISVIDQNDIQIKKLQQAYHVKFLKILPAGMVLLIIKAEDKFHRMAFKRMAKHDSDRQDK